MSIYRARLRNTSNALVRTDKCAKGTAVAEKLRDVMNNFNF